MKVSAITSYNISAKQIRKQKTNSTGFDNVKYQNSFYQLDIPFVYPISFTSIQNSSKLRVLFGYDLPCIYSGITMIDPKHFSRMLKSQVFNRPSSEVVKYLEKYSDSISGMEKHALKILSARSKMHPQSSIQELLEEIEPIYRTNLRRTQTPILRTLVELSKQLPQQQLENFNLLMSETYKRLSKEPVKIPFSSYEFKYKMAKIKDDILKTDNTKSKKVMNKLMKESKKLSNTTNKETLEYQKKVMGMMEWVLKKSVLKDNPQLNNLIKTSKARLSNTEIIVPFSRKSFLYDLIKIIDNIKDKDLRDKMITTACQLPTSNQNFSAYILKMTHEPSEKICSRILWPYLASVEHLLPRSCGGADEMANFAGATTKENSMRKSIDFVDQIKRRPKTPIYCQKYVDRLIVLYDEGIFDKCKISPKYIIDFKNTIYKLSNETINLDISKLYQSERFKKYNITKSNYLIPQSMALGAPYAALAGDFDLSLDTSA